MALCAGSLLMAGLVAVGNITSMWWAVSKLRGEIQLGYAQSNIQKLHQQ